MARTQGEASPAHLKKERREERIKRGRDQSPNVPFKVTSPVT
jgi:hypothetical protein